MLFLLNVYNHEGITYESKDMRILQKVTRKSILPSFEIKGSVEEIIAGSVIDSAFSLCSKNIGEVTFEQNSKLSKLGEYVFSQTSITTIDMKNCGNLLVISKYAFMDCKNLNKVFLPPKLQNISEKSFNNIAIDSIQIPDSVVCIGIYGFANSGTLTNVEIGKNSALKRIEAHAFMNTRVESFFFPKTVETIGSAPFLATGTIKSYEVDSENKNYSSSADKKTIFKDGGKTIVLAAEGITGEYKCPQDVTVIGSQAFRGAKYNSIVLSDKITEIGTYAFSSTQITSLNIPNTLRIIGNYAFAGSQLQSISLPEGMTELRSSAFREASKLTTVNLPSTLESIGDFAFCQCSSLKSIVIPANVTKFGSSVFSLCHKDINVTFLNTDKYQIVNGMVFSEGNLIEYFGSDENAVLEIPKFCIAVPTLLFARKVIKSVTFQSGGTQMTFGEKSFSESTLTSITFPSYFSSMGKMCFQKCPNLLEVIFSNTCINTIPENAFSECSKLHKIVFANSNVNTIGTFAFSNSPITEVDFRQSTIEKIEENAFSYINVTRIDLPSTLTNMNPFAFAECKELTAVIMEACTNLNTIEKYVFSGCTKLSDIILGPNITELDEKCFRECTSIEIFTLAPTTQFLRENCFLNCRNLKVICIPSGSQLNRIYPFALEGCTNLMYFDVTESNEFRFDKGTLMSYDWKRLIFYLPTTKRTSLIISGIVEDISDYAFQSCLNIQEVIISDGALKRVGYQAFNGCKNLRRVVIPESVTTIEKEAFTGCNRLKCGCVVIPKSKNVQAIEAGIPESVLTEHCTSSGCKVFFDEITCKVNKVFRNTIPFAFLYSVLFITPF